MTITLSRRWCYALILASVSTVATAQKASTYYYRTVQDSIHANNLERNLIPMYSIAGQVTRSSIIDMMKQDSIPGVSIAFVDKGEIAWTKSYGHENLDDSARVTSSTVFTGASLSKPLTAIAALRLVEAGKLSLTDDVNSVLKEWKVPETDLTANEKVTLERLIGHKAGIKNDLWSSYLPGDTIPTLNQLLAGEAPSVDPATSVTATPGSSSFYSNPGYSIIQKLLMDQQNQPFHKIIEELVFRPLDMANSSFKQPIPAALENRRAVGHHSDLTPYPYRIFPYQAAGGVWTTPTDLAKFMVALLDDYHQGSNTLLSKKMSRTVFRKDIRRYAFTLWNWGEDIVFQHFGSNQGFNCFMYGSIEKQQGIVVMTNSDNAFGFFDYVQRAVNHEYEWEYVRPEILEPIQSEISWADAYLGTYRWRGNTLKLSKEDGNLIVSSDESVYILAQTNTREFILPEVPLKITFSENEQDYFQGMTIWGPGGGPTTVTRIETPKEP